MKFRFKFIAFVILGLLVLVCSYQVYWLVNFYNEQYRKMETAIMHAMNNADFKEIAIRINDIHADSDSLPKQNMKGIMARQQERMPDVVVRIQNNKKDGKIIWSDANTMNVSVQQGFHLTIDSLKSIDIARYDSLLKAEFKQLGIKIPYYLVYRTNINDSSPNPNIKDFDQSKYEKYVFAFTDENKEAYIVYMKEPKWHIFKDMLGLVSISVLMIALLIISYLYLLKIILKQKTIDEIKSDFVNNMTHELKTPISVTYAAVDALQNFGASDEPEKRDKYLNISKEQLMYLNSLVEQILTMSVEERKNLRLSLVDIELKSLFENSKNQILLNTSKPVSFEIEIKPENLLVKADRLHFGNLINNLVENAVKYSPESVNIKLSAYTENRQTIISVCDDGIGIPANSLDKIFDKFYRVPTGNIHEVKGYGLGLYYVKTIIDKHGWKIKVDSTEGKGTCFKIIIP
ncbi:cell wall metabolism sensor histidine kinase WalK [Prevotella sp. 10(H)]|uniref:sensor histidine kinase n=1 Tax=Prevotella sp. 10(H) TaxID=1158294 RepID=UPI0004A71312|nr:HAMP domain-containing sensor histidine kinase [Prevotella sp. 10(H)]